VQSLANQPALSQSPPSPVQSPQNTNTDADRSESDATTTNSNSNTPVYRSTVFIVLITIGAFFVVVAIVVIVFIVIRRRRMKRESNRYIDLEAYSEEGTGSYLGSNSKPGTNFVFHDYY